MVLSGACTVVEVTGTRGTAGVWVATGALTCVAPTAAAASANNLSTRSMVWIRNFPVDLISLVIPKLLGGGQYMLIGNLIFGRNYFLTGSAPVILITDSSNF